MKTITTIATLATIAIVNLVPAPAFALPPVFRKIATTSKPVVNSPKIANPQATARVLKLARRLQECNRTSKVEQCLPLAFVVTVKVKDAEGFLNGWQYNERGDLYVAEKFVNGEALRVMYVDIKTLKAVVASEDYPDNFYVIDLRYVQ